MFERFRNALYEWWDKREKRRAEEHEVQRLEDVEFKRTHEPCPVCDEWIQKGLSTCPHCEAPFRDPVALQTWKLKQEVAELREQAAEAREQEKKERSDKRGNLQGCGCLLILGALIFAFLFPPLGGLMFLVGVIVLIVGLFS